MFCFIYLGVNLSFGFFLLLFGLLLFVIVCSFMFACCGVTCVLGFFVGLFSLGLDLVVLCFVFYGFVMYFVTLWFDVVLLWLG